LQVHIKSCDREVQPMIPHSSTLARRAATYLFLLMPAIVAPQASADTSYLRPSWFTTATDDLVTAHSSFTESFSNPAIGVRSEAWTVIAPDGARSTFKTKVELTQLTALEADTKPKAARRSREAAPAETSNAEGALTRNRRTYLNRTAHSLRHYLRHWLRRF
jgi:SMC interacting uncharacterized protein involved in chromosome segregation